MIEARNAPFPLSAQGFQIVRRPPCAALSGIVTELIGYRETQAGHFRQSEPASLIAPLVVSFGEPFSIALGREPCRQDRIATFAAGLSNGHVVIDSFGAAHCLQINFTPQGAWRFFGIPMNEFADRMVTLEDIWGSDASLVSERLSEAVNWDQCFNLVEQLVLTRISTAPNGSPTVRLAYQMLVATGGNARIGALARRLDCSRKHLAQKFQTEIGLGPKAVARIARFGRAYSLVQSGYGDLADIAVECGYADQAHFGREFRTLSGKTPTAMQSGIA